MFPASNDYHHPKKASHTDPTEKYKKVTYNGPIVVFDIDKVLAKPWELTIDSKREDFARVRKLFGKEQDMHFLDILGYPHQIYLGTYAILRALKDRNVEIAFFSSGVEKRNVLLVKRLYEIAFGKESEALFEKTSIYSRHHCISTQRLKRENYEEDDREKEAREFFPNIFGCHFGQLKKDLRILLLDPKTATEVDLVNLHRLGKINLDNPKVSELLKNVVLIEDDSSYMAKHQEYNLLYVRDSYNSFLQDPGHRKIDLTKDDTVIHDDYFKDFYHLFYAYYILDEALDLYEKEGMFFRDAMASVQMRHNDKELFELERKTPLVGHRNGKFHYNTNVEIACYKKGLKGLQPYWPTLDFVDDVFTKGIN